jgi:hypothetical protein
MPYGTRGDSKEGKIDIQFSLGDLRSVMFPTDIWLTDVRVRKCGGCSAKHSASTAAVGIIGMRKYDRFTVFGFMHCKIGCERVVLVMNQPGRRSFQISEPEVESRVHWWPALNFRSED